MSNLLIPKGFKKVAVSSDNICEVSAYFSEERKEFFCTIVTIDGENRSFGPIKPSCLPMWIHCLSDILGMKGRFCYID